jgi:glutathione S-transferase
MELVDGRLRALSKELGEREYFGKSFSIADIVMTTVLKTASRMGSMGSYPNLVAYIERNESRPAFKRALADHEKLYDKK